MFLNKFVPKSSAAASPFDDVEVKRPLMTNFSLPKTEEEVAEIVERGDLEEIKALYAMVLEEMGLIPDSFMRHFQPVRDKCGCF
jgi:hypothetical protein